MSFKTIFIFLLLIISCQKKNIPHIEVLVESVGQLKSYFEQAKWDENLKNCYHFSYLEKYPTDYLRCNPLVLNCLFSGRLTGKKYIEVELDGRKYEISAKQLEKSPYFPNGKYYDTYSSRLSNELPINYGHVFYLKINSEDQGHGIVLEDTCKDRYLPQRAYTSKKIIKKRNIKKVEKFKWDNLGKNYYLDRYLVNNQAIYDWRSKMNSKEKMPAVEEWHKPATDLKAEEMKEYCHFRGENVLTSLLFEAGSYLLVGKNKKDIHPMRLSPVPWSKKFSNTFLAKVQKTKKPQINKSNCSLLYSSECLNILPYSIYENNNPSWMGLSNILGGSFEHLENPIYPDDNIKASSFYYPQYSLKHSISERVSWNGLTNFKEDLKWKSSAESYVSELPVERKRYKIGFRCFSKRAGL